MSDKVSFTIKPYRTRSIWEEAGEILRYRELLQTMAMRDVQIRYKQAAIGVLWVVLQPILTSAIFTFIFSYLAKIPSQGVPYPIFVFSGLLLWQYFSRVVSEGSGSLVANANIITKIYFPRLLIPLTVVISAGVDFLLASVVLVAMMLIFGVALPWTIIFIPVFMLMAGVLGYAIALWLAPLNAIYRDISIALPFMVQIGMYLTPVIYPLSVVPEKWQWVFMLNPVATIVESMRWAVLGTPAPTMAAYAIYAGITLFMILVGLRIFRKLEPTLVDRI